MCKKLFLLISLVLVLGLVSNASADPNLVAYYTLDGDANDTGNVSPAADGALHGNPGWTTGRVGLGGSIDLDGDGDFVQIPDANKLDITKNLTVAFWLRVDDFGSQWQAIVIKGIAWDNNVWKFEQDEDGDILFVVEGGAPYTTYGTTKVDDGQWHHVAGVYDGATGVQTLYVDGVYDNSSSGALHAIPINDLDLFISLVKDGEYIDGGCDDLRIYNRVLSASEIWDLYNIPQLMAHYPDPPTGEVGVTADANLIWTAGANAVTHDVYIGTDEAAVADANTSSDEFKGNQALDANSHSPTDPFVLGEVTYYWRIDEVNSAGLPEWPGWVWSFKTASACATDPGPADGELYAPLDANLTWTAGYGALRHKVCFGTVSPPPLVAEILMTDDPNTSWDPPGDLTPGVTYYWKIVAYDYLSGGSGNVAIGPEWSFRATNQLRGWWKFDDGDGNTPDDSSGNNNHAYFGTENAPNSLPTWTTSGRIDGALEFDGDQDWVEVARDPNFDITESMTVTVWIKINDFGGDLQSIIGKFDNWKFEKAAGDTILWVIEGGAPWTTYGNISIGDGEFHHLAGVYDGTTGEQYLYVDGVEDNMTSDTPHAIPTSTFPLYIGSNGLDCVIDDLRVYDYDLSAAEIWDLYNVPWPYAHNANPANKSTAARNLDGLLTLSWTAGTDATSHDVYFGTDFNDVNDATTSTPVIYKGNQLLGDVDYVAGPLETEKTYYWRIDELGAPGSPWKGAIWRFTTAEYIFVDDFEDYNNTSNKIQDTWIKGGGGTVGYPDPNYAEITIVYGGEQSMPFDYNNVESPYDSNATRTFTSWQDWTAAGVKSLELWFRGWPASVGSWVESSGTHTITASGEDILNVPDLRGTGYHDEFHYAYKEITGTPTTGVTTIIAKVESVSPTDPWAKAGVMIRQSLDPNSTNGFMCITPEMGAAFQYRDTAGGLSTSYDYEDDPCMANVNAPYWVKMTFTIPGYYVRGYYSATGADGSWITTTAGPPLTIPVYVGLAVTAHNPAATCTAEFSNVSITAPGMTISPSWSHQDIGIKSNVAAPLYVTLQDDGSVGGDTATVTHTDPNIVLQTTWQAWWDIALNDFKVNNPSLDLEKIKKITLGVGPADPCGTGTLYFDDIRLYEPRCIPEYVAASFNDDCVVDLNDLGIMTDDWLLSEYNVDAETPSDANLVALYEFATIGANFNDTSGNDHHGTGNGDAETVYDAVRNSNVLSLDGDGDYVVITGSNTPGGAFDINDVITVACWIKVTEFDEDWQAIVTKGDNSWRMARASSGTGEGVEFACSGLSPYQWVSGDIRVDDGQWHHVAGVYDGSKLCIYVDGILGFFENTSGSISNSEYNVYIGANEQEAGREWNGQIDELRIYNRALSHGEIVSLAGESQVLQPLLRPEIDLYEDGEVNFKDYAVLANVWLEAILWP